MTSARPSEITFTPGMAVGDSTALAWMQQVTLRLRREVSWDWHQRGVSQPDDGRLAPGDGPPPVQRSLDLLRYWDARRAYFETDVTAAYLTRKIGPAPEATVQPNWGSFGWVVETLALDHAATFALALGLVARFDAAAGPVFAACQGDSTRTEPSLALVQRLWDEPERCLGLADPSHPLWRYGLLQSASKGVSSAEWDAAYAITPSAPVCPPGPCHSLQPTCSRFAGRLCRWKRAESIAGELDPSLLGRAAGLDTERLRVGAVSLSSRPTAAEVRAVAARAVGRGLNQRLESSRYARVAQSPIQTRDRREINVVRLRHLPTVGGAAYAVQGNDRLDVMVQRRYADPTRFWHIGDANTELYVPRLLSRVLRIVIVPEQ